VKPIHIRSTEDQAVVQVALHGVDESLCNAVRRCGRVTFFQAVKAFLNRLSAGFDFV
jgi:hypothetical protein